jgi:putative FmdB family regulatory protein
MANYEYMCEGCSKRVTVARSITEQDPGYTCQECDAKLLRVYSGSRLGVTFNGSGFYSKDK